MLLLHVIFIWFLHEASLTNLLRNLNDTSIILTSDSSPNSRYSPILSKKQLITLGPECKNNPLLDIISNSNIAGSLKTTPTKNNISECPIGETTCCDKETFRILYVWFNESVIPDKLLLFQNNLNYYQMIIQEHKRTLIDGFSFSIDQFEALFSSYQSIIDDIFFHAQNIVKDSLKLKWNSVCNYVCNYDYVKNNLCKFYNSTYTFNNTQYNDIEYECDIYNSSRLSNLKQQSFSYLHSIRNLNKTLDDIYDKTLSEIDLIADMEANTRNLTMNNTSSGYRLLVNSIKDGLYSSKINSPNLVCENVSVTSIEFPFGYKLSCEHIVNKLCYGLECLDDSLMQLAYTSDDVNDMNRLISNSKFFRFINAHNGTIEGKEISSGGWSDDAFKLIDENIAFVSKGEYLVSTIVIFIFAGLF